MPQSSWVTEWSAFQSGKSGRPDKALANLSRGMRSLTSADPKNIPSMQESVLEVESEPISFAVVTDVVWKLGGLVCVWKMFPTIYISHRSDFAGTVFFSVPSSIFACLR